MRFLGDVKDFSVLDQIQDEEIRKELSIESTKTEIIERRQRGTLATKMKKADSEKQY